MCFLLRQVLFVLPFSTIGALTIAAVLTPSLILTQIHPYAPYVYVCMYVCKDSAAPAHAMCLTSTFVF